MKTAAAISTALLCGFVWPVTAQADGWQYRFTPYLWVPSMSTDMSVGSSPNASSDVGLFDVLQFGFLATAEARKGDWGILGEVNYLSLSQNADWGDHFGAKIKLKGAMGSAAVAYRFARSDAGWADVFAGARYWWMKPTINFDRLPTVKKSKSWVDPIVGLRGQYSLTDSVYVAALGDIGGFGVGSHFQWEVVGTVGYKFSDTVSAELGYRYLSVNFKDGALDMDTRVKGPLVAVNFSF